MANAGSFSENKEGYHLVANKKKATARHTEDTPVKSFLDMIAPSVVQFNPDHFICGNTFRCVWALREYPTQTD